MLIEACEALEDAPVCGSDAGSVVGDGERDDRIVRRQRGRGQLDVAWRTAFSSMLPTARRRSSPRLDTAAPETAEVSMVIVVSALRRRADSESTTSSRSSGARGGGAWAGVDPCEVEKIVYEVLHALVLGKQPSGDGRPVSTLGVLESHLEFDPARGQWCAQFVRRVGHEPTCRSEASSSRSSMVFMVSASPLTSSGSPGRTPVGRANGR